MPLQNGTVGRENMIFVWKGLFVNFYRECCAAHAENRRGSYNFHGVRRTFGHLSGNNRQGSAFDIGSKFALLGRGIETELGQFYAAVRPSGESRIINESDADAAIGFS